MIKRLSSVLLSFILLIVFTVPSMASNELENFNHFASKNSLSTHDVSYYTLAFNEMSDNEFDQTIVELIKNTSNLTTLRNNLLYCGIELGDVIVTTHTNGNSRTLQDDDTEIILTSARRSGQSYYHLLVTLEFSYFELYPTSKDGLAFYFDSRKADYVGYNSSTDHGFRLSSGQQATNGTLVFNFDDSLVDPSGYSDSFYTAIYADPHSNTQLISFGADYVHTYGDVSFHPSGGEIMFSFGPMASGSVAVNFSIVEEENKWQIAALSEFG